MAAFEQVSRLMFQPHEAEAHIDIRRTMLPTIRPDMDDYDPKDYRAPVHEIKLWMAYFNLLRSVCGAGMLAMPLVISQMGVIMGPILTMFAGFLLLHTHYMLLDSLYEIARQLKIPYISYRYGFRLALLHGPPMFHWIARRGPTIIATFMFSSQLGICTLFVIFTTDSLRDLMDWQSSKPALLCLLFPYLLMEFFMKDLSVVSYVSMFGNFLNLAGIVVVCIHVVVDANRPEMVRANMNVQTFFFGFGILLFNLSIVGVLLYIDKSLVNTRVLMTKFGVINVGMVCPTIISIIFGTLGYWAFGTMEENVLRSLPYDEFSSMISIGLYMVAVAFTYPLQCYPAIATVIEVIKYHDQHHTTPSDHTLHLIESISRPLFVVLSFFIAYLVPFQGPFVAFVGNLCTSMLALVFPALMDMCLRYPFYYGNSNFYLFRDLFILALGLASMLFGVYFCGYLIHVRILSQKSPNNYGFF